MNERRIQSAMERIMMDESVTEELADDEAKVLLGWGEQQVTRLADQIADEEAFKEASNQLRKLMRRVNRFVGLRGDMDAEEQREKLERIVTAAQELGFGIVPEMAAVFLQGAPPADNVEAVRQLTDLIAVDPTDDTTDPATDTPSDVESPDESSWLW
jgi:hypothetical protein